MKVLLSFFILFTQLIALEIIQESVSNGQTAMVLFDKKEGVKKVKVGTKSYKVFDTPSKSSKVYALIPISYYAKPHTQKVYFNKDFFYLDIEDGHYKKETIHVQKSKVNPKSDIVKKRTSQEYAQAMKIYNTITPKNYVNTPFIVPMQSKITSDFGKARVYNDTLKGYHSGTDFRAEIGTPVIASNDGIVVLAKNRFYAGNSIIIDHGEGVYTCYYHLSDFKVKKGDRVTKAQIIGLSGDTGRITGPHLHFSARVGGVQVDPLQLISLLNQNLYKE
jgi:murein DD-endopeptidase MepM/ murein hydrolase activator NlpD